MINHRGTAHLLRCIVPLLIALLLSPAFSAERPLDGVPLFTDQDLERYRTHQPLTGTEKEITDPPEIRSRPAPSRDVNKTEALFRENSSAVVSLVAYNKGDSSFRNGSGFIVRSDGIIVTNYHVINNAAVIQVKAGKRVFNVVGLLYTDKETDIAILKAEQKNLHAVTLGDSDSVTEEESVYVMSNPRGEHTIISEGVVLGLKEFGPYRKMFQITAPFSQGSSGGPLFNQNGEVIGIATLMLASETQSLHFAIPVNLVKERLGTGTVTLLKDTEVKTSQITADYFLSLGNKHFQAGKYSDAVDAYTKALTLDPESENGYNNLGASYMKLKRTREAVGAYQEALRRNPDAAVARANLGLAYIELGLHREAADTLKEATRLMPDLAIAHTHLGTAYRGLKMYREAVEAYKQSLRIDPRSGETRFGLGITYLSLNDKASALQEYKILKDINPALARTLSNFMQ